MADTASRNGREPRTVLEHLLWQQDRTYEEIAAEFGRIADGLNEDATLSTRHLRRLASGERGNTTPVTRRVLQAMFGKPLNELLRPWEAATSAVERTPSGLVIASGQPDPDKELITLAARRAKAFALTANQGNLTGEVMEQIHEDIRQLATDYPQRPLSELLGDLVQTQETLYTLLDSRQRPEQARQLYFLTGVTSGLLAKASHDLADPHSAMTQARAAYLCAENADHNGLRAWIRGLQALIAYWAGRLHESVKYAQSGAEFAALSHSTTSVWLPISEARAWAALGNVNQTHAAIRRAEEAWNEVRSDEVDELGGLCSFGRTRQIYYAADALAWLPSEAGAAQDYAAQAVDVYADTSGPEWAFGDAAGSRADLAIARIHLGQLEGAYEAVSPILELAPENRINGIINSAMRVHKALSRSPLAPSGSDLQERIEMFTRTPLRSLPR
ncbi:hypothetical protein [Streptomyces roseoverticillatus]|uniref:hypothetical protein n=1 Tax=Streptomyces roseoverticillatus TaxID=66429 RepID=UPI001F1EEC09|nr:hypothetical protein [Streptomyces roseoverticillatus]